LLFSQQPLGISVRNFTRLFDYPMYTLVPTANWHLMTFKLGHLIVK